MSKKFEGGLESAMNHELKQEITQLNNQSIKMENQLGVSKEVSLAISKHDISANHFAMLENMKPVAVEATYFNISKMVKVNDIVDIIVTDFIPDMEMKDKVTDGIEFISNFEGVIKNYIYTGSRIVRVVKSMMEKLKNQGVENPSNIPLRITYKGKTRGNNGQDFDDFDIVGLV